MKHNRTQLKKQDKTNNTKKNNNLEKKRKQKTGENKR